MNDNQRMYWVVGVGVVVLLALWWWKMPQENVIASGHPEWQPIMYKDGDTINGAGPALLKKILTDDNGIKVTFPYTGTWDDVQAKAKSGDVDMLVAAYKTTEREGYMLYSDPYTTDPVAVYVKAGKTFSLSDDWHELTTKKGVAMVGDSYGQKFDDFIANTLKDKVTRVKTSQDAFGMLTSGKADYFVYSLYAGDKEIKNQNLTGQVESLPKYIAEENFYITISKKSPFTKYMSKINAGIAKYKADGTIANLIEQYKNQE